MMGGVNVAAAAAIPVVVLLGIGVVVVGAVVIVFVITQQNLLEKNKKFVCLVLCEKAGINSWTLKFTFFQHDFFDEALQFFKNTAQIEAIKIIQFQEELTYELNITSNTGWEFSHPNDRQSYNLLKAPKFQAKNTGITLLVSREELLLYRGENDTDNKPKFCEINVNCQSNPDSNLDMTVKHKEEELFKIIKEKMKQCVCQMFFDFKKGDDNIVNRGYSGVLFALAIL